MTLVLNYLSKSPLALSLEPEELLRIVQLQIVASPESPGEIKLERGTATIPLRGIDVPFHSTYLRSGISPYRKFLGEKILEESIDPDKLIGKFIPNVTAEPFAVDRPYIENAAQVTGSLALKELLQTVSILSFY